MLFLIRLILILPWIAVSATAGILCGLVRPFHPNNIHVTARLIAFSRKILGFRMIVRNRDEFKIHQPCVVVSNHQDNMDIFPGAMTIPERTVTIGKKSILWIPFFGQFYWLSGNILIDRKNKKSAFETMDQAAKAIREKNLTVWIMPEGTRSRGRGLLPFKKGPFITAIKAQVPIVPVAISNYLGHIKLNKWNSGVILIEVLPAISTEGLKIEDANDLKDKVHAAMKTAIAKLDLEVKNSFSTLKEIE